MGRVAHGRARTTSSERSDEVLGPAGSSGKVFLPDTGQYVIEVANNLGFTGNLSEATGAYDLTVFTPQASQISLDTQTSDTLVSYGLDLHTFNGIAGEHVNAALMPGAAGGPSSFQLFDPNGDLIAGVGAVAFSETRPLTLQETGTYSILVDGLGDEAGGL